MLSELWRWGVRTRALCAISWDVEPALDSADMLVAWLASDTSLIEPSHLSVSVDEVLSELLLSAMLLLEADSCSCRSCWEFQLCDDRDSSSSLS